MFFFKHWIFLLVASTERSGWSVDRWTVQNFEDHNDARAVHNPVTSIKSNYRPRGDDKAQIPNW